MGFRPFFTENELKRTRTAEPWSRFSRTARDRHLARYPGVTNLVMTWLWLRSPA
jgi:hypothetical protein